MQLVLRLVLLLFALGLLCSCPMYTLPIKPPELHSNHLEYALNLCLLLMLPPTALLLTVLSVTAGPAQTTQVSYGFHVLDKTNEQKVQSRL